MEDKTTPRPWAVNDAGLITSTVGNVRFIARVETHDGPWLDKEDAANAAHIVRCVNGWDALQAVREQHDAKARAANFDACGCDYCAALKAAEEERQ